MDYSKNGNKKNVKRNNSKEAKIKTKSNATMTRVIISLMLIICFAIVGGLFGIYLAILRNAEPLPVASVAPNIYTTKIIVDETGEVYDTLDASENRIYATLDQIPDHLEHAFIAIEDARFYNHNGVDIKGSLRSVYSTIFKGNSQGGSTITQQLIKNARGLSRNNIITKLQEQYLAVKYEKDLTKELGSKKAAKDHILELYLNTIAMGHGLNGVQTAANYYFDKDVSEVTIAESAVLAAITQYPSGHAPDDYPEKNYVRADITLSYMLEQGYITDEEYVDAKFELDNEVYERIANSRKVIEEEESSTYSYYTDQVITEIIDDLEELGYTRAEASNIVYNGGLEIHIPMDPIVQDVLEETYLDDSFFPDNQFKIEVQYYLSVQNDITGETTHYERRTYVDSEEEIAPFEESVKAELLGVNDTIIAERTIPVVQPQSSFVVIDQHTGAVKGVVGGRGEKTSNRSLNRATQSVRQPGSTFKVLSVYAPGIDIGLFYPGYVIDDVPTKPDSSGKSFENWNGRYEGLMPIRRAIYNSVNTVAVRGMEQIGVDTSYAYLENFGFTTLVDGEVIDGKVYSDKNLSTALGGITYGVTNLELTAAYATIANSGNYIEPYFYTEVYDHNGNLILKNEPETRKVLSDDTAYLVTDMLEDVITKGTGSKASLASIGIPVAGKTGTTSDDKDLAFVGYTPYYTAGVMYGYDMPRSIPGSTSAHVSIWQHIMYQIHTRKNLPATSFVEPPTIVRADICLDSGLLATELCYQDPRGSRVVTEVFSSSNVPTDYCDVHKAVEINVDDGLLATEYTPEEKVATIVGLDKKRNYYNTYSYVDNYFSIVEDAKYEIPTTYSDMYNEENTTPIIDPEDGLLIDGDGDILDLIDGIGDIDIDGNNSDEDDADYIVDEDDLPPQYYYEDEDGNIITDEVINPTPDVPETPEPEIETPDIPDIPEVTEPEEIPEFNDDTLIIP